MSRGRRRLKKMWMRPGAGLWSAWLGATWMFAAQVPDQGHPDYYAPDRQLEKYVSRALDENPSIQASLARYRAALQKVPQVTALPDPMLTFSQFVRSVETRVGPQLNSLMISQKFPWFGKLDLEGKLAMKASLARYQQYRARQREVILQVKRAYYELVFLDRALGITREERSLLQHYEALARARYAAGQGIQQAVIKIQAEISRLMDRLRTLEQQRDSAAARLNTLMNRPPEEPLPPTAEPPTPEVALELNELYQLGEANREELKAAMALIEREEKAVDLARKQFWPDLTLSAGTVNVGPRDDPAGLLMPPPDNGKNAYSFSVALNIPIRRDKYHAGVVEAAERLVAERRNYEDLRNQMRFAIRDQVLRLETLREQIQLFDRVLIPQAREALRSTEAAYETGQLGALDLLDSERFLIQIRLIHARYRADYLNALAELERALGTRFPR